MTKAQRLAQRVIGRNGRYYAPKARHGTVGGHDYWGCRCNSCVEAHWEYQSDYRNRTRHNKRVIQELIAQRYGLEVPEPVLSPADEPAAEPTEEQPKEPDLYLESGLPVPPMSNQVRDQLRLRDLSHLEELAQAYWNPKTATAIGKRSYRTFDATTAVVEGEKIIKVTREQEPEKKERTKSTAKPSDHKGLMKSLKESGAEITRTGSGHIQVSGNGKTYLISSTPSDPRAVRNAVAGLKRRGILK